MTTDGRRRVVVTGMGAISPVGNDVESTWAGLLAGKSGGGPISLFDATEEFATRIACEVKDFDPTDVLDPKETRRFDRFAKFALVVAQEAMDAAGLSEGTNVDGDRFGVIFGSGIGGMKTFEDQTRTLVQRGPSRVSPFFIPMFIPDIAAGLISIRFGARGPNYATVSACASSAHAIADAYRTVQRGEADVMLAGGTEAAVTPLTIAGFSSMKAMSTRNEDGATASRPFDAGRDGFVLGEGAAALVLESLDHARQRGASILGEIAGCGLTGDAFHITSPPPEHEGAQRAMRMAMEGAGATPDDVDYINAHGTSTPVNDMNETQAIKAVLVDPTMTS